MRNKITMGSLFSGSGGFELAGQMAGIVPVWASEIEPFPLLVTKKRFPNMLHLGDIKKMDGGKIPKVEIMTGGSPCQDMSIAGKREGLDGSRSNLFREQIRIVKEMRESDKADGRTGSDIRPRYMVWENVPGAFSSNKGEDFKCVLEEICRVADAEVSIPRPSKGKWGARNNHGRWVFSRLENSRCSILGSPPTKKENLPCRRFWRRIRTTNII